MNMLELKECLIRILDRAEQNAKQGQLGNQDDFDLSDCLKQIKRELLELQWKWEASPANGCLSSKSLGMEQKVPSKKQEQE